MKVQTDYFVTAYFFCFCFAKYIDKDASKDYDIKEVDFDLIFFSGGNTK